MAAHGNHPAVSTEEDKDTKTASEQEAQKQQQEYYQEEAPETGQIDFFLQMAGAVGLTYASKRQEVTWAFDKLNDPQFEHEILKVMDPRKFQELKTALKIAEKELKTQKGKNDKRGVEKEEAEVGVWKLKRKLGFAAFDRKKQAFEVAEAVQTRITATEIKIKLTNTSNLYGVELGTLQRGLAGWLKEHPGKGIEEYIASFGGKLYREKLAKEGKQQEKDIDKKLRKANESARSQAAKENREQIIRAQSETKKTLSLSKNQAIDKKNQILYVLKGGAAPPIQPMVPPTPPQPVVAAAPPAPPPSMSPVPVSVPRFSLPSFSIPRVSFPHIGPILGKGGMFSKSFNLASKGLGQLFKRGADLLLPGSGVALDILGKISDVIRSWTGFDPKKGLVYITIGVGVLIISIPTILGVGVYSWVTGSNPMIIKTSDNNLGWDQFTQQYLSIDNNNLLSWRQFEKSSLTPQKQYLSLDANRHDDMEK